MNALDKEFTATLHKREGTGAWGGAGIVGGGSSPSASPISLAVTASRFWRPIRWL